MADKLSSTIKVVDFGSFKEFQAELQKPERSHIRLVKVDDQGLVEPAKKGTAFVMQPRVRIVATAFDHKTNPNQILRWQHKWDVGGGTLTINAMSGQGVHRDPTGARTRDQTIAALELMGYQVSPGEWTPASIAGILAGTAVS
jgi:hypothetical protein